MNVNKTIHEAMGGGGFKLHKDLSPTYPNYTDPIHYYALMDWLKLKERWFALDNWMFASNFGNDGICYLLEKPTQEQITLIAEAIEAGVLK